MRRERTGPQESSVIGHFWGFALGHSLTTDAEIERDSAVGEDEVQVAELHVLVLLDSLLASAQSPGKIVAPSVSDDAGDGTLVGLILWVGKLPVG